MSVVKAKIHLNGEQLEDESLDKLASSLYKTGIQVGESIQFHPFNTYHDENTKHVGKRTAYTDKPLRVDKIVKNYYVTWNSVVVLEVVYELSYRVR